MTLIRYWFKFDLDISQKHPIGVLPGCGVTAYSYEDALAMIKEKVFRNDPLPPIKSIDFIENRVNLSHAEL